MYRGSLTSHTNAQSSRHRHTHIDGLVCVPVRWQSLREPGICWRILSQIVFTFGMCCMCVCLYVCVSVCVSVCAGRCTEGPILNNSIGALFMRMGNRRKDGKLNSVPVRIKTKENEMNTAHYTALKRGLHSAYLRACRRSLSCRSASCLNHEFSVCKQSDLCRHTYTHTHRRTHKRSLIHAFRNPCWKICTRKCWLSTLWNRMIRLIRCYHWATVGKPD